MEDRNKQTESGAEEHAGSVYRRRRKVFDAQAQSLASRSSLLANLRLFMFVAFAALLVFGLWDLDQPRLWALAVAGAAFLGFVVLVFWHSKVISKQRRAEGLAQINVLAQHRLSREYQDLPVPRSGYDDHPPALAVDLDLFGQASLFQLLGSVQTPPGRQTLARWLLDPATREEIRSRQRALADLAPDLDFRQELEYLGRPLGAEEPDVEPFLSWAESPSWLNAKPWLVWLTRLSPLVLLGLLVADGLDVLPSVFWLPLAIFHLLLTGIYFGRLNRSFGGLASGDQAFERYAGVFRFLARSNFEAEGLRETLDTLGKSGAHRHLERLELIMGFAELRRSAMAYLPVQAFTLWDFHCLSALERWQARAGGKVRGWLSALGEVEALCALSSPVHDHPHWTMPRQADEGQVTVSAKDLAHPLLPQTTSVPNHVTLGPPGHFLLVTGSNMSGKSTLLRAIGVNLILAQAGGPVCAREFVFSPCVLGTSFRIRDSLERGVSYFMAELEHLKRVVDLAQKTQRDGAHTLLYLFDEILLGTNVVERQVAVRRVLEHLLKLDAIGAIATHDLHVAEEGVLAQARQAVHFCEQFVQGEDGAHMTFDYKLRPGLAPTTNALKLLALVGLGPESEA